MKKIKIALQILLFLFPWILRRPLLNLFFQYKIHRTAKIGFSLVLADGLVMDPRARIGNLTFINNINRCILKSDSKIGSLNWITGTNTANKRIFQYSKNRVCELIVGLHTRITEKHFIDCNGGVYIGDYTTIAGIKTVILSHSIDIRINRQTAEAINVGQYCFIGTNCILLKGTSIPDFSVLGAGAVVTKKFDVPYSLYAGNPARQIKNFTPDEVLYFSRTHGNVP